MVTAEAFSLITKKQMKDPFLCGLFIIILVNVFRELSFELTLNRYVFLNVSNTAVNPPPSATNPIKPADL